MPDYIAQYRIYLEQEKHASANTVSSYIRDVTQFCAWLPEGSDLRRVKPAAVSDYLTYLTDRGRSAATVIRSAASIKSFYNYLVVSDAMKANPAKGIAAAKAERKCPQILTGREVELLLEQPKCVDEKGFRDQGIPGPCHAGAAVRHRHPGVGADCAESGGCKSAGGVSALRRRKTRTDHPAVSPGGEGSA